VMPNAVEFKDQITQIMCQIIQDRRGYDTESTGGPRWTVCGVAPLMVPLVQQPIGNFFYHLAYLAVNSRVPRSSQSLESSDTPFTSDRTFVTRKVARVLQP